MKRQHVQQVVVLLATLACCAAILQAYAARGGPYFARPVTVIDHVIPGAHPIREVLLRTRTLEQAMPAGATVAVVRATPAGAAVNDTETFLAASGSLPRHRVVPLPPEGTGPDYVITIGGALADPRYEPLAHALYVRKP